MKSSTVKTIALLGVAALTYQHFKKKAAAEAASQIGPQQPNDNPPPSLSGAPHYCVDPKSPAPR